jgi:hypothetical protein
MFERCDLGVLKKEAKAGAKELARLGEKVARERIRQKALEAKRAKEAAATAKREAEAAAKERESHEVMEAKRAKEAAALAKREAEAAAKEKERQKALEAKKAKEAVALAQREAEAAVKEKARQAAEAVREREKQEALEAKKAKEAVALAKREAEAAAKEKARQAAEAVREREKQEALEAKKAKEAAALAQREAEKVAKEKARQAAEAVREREKQEALEAKKAKEATALAQREAEKVAKEKARQAAEAVREREKQEALEAKKAKEAAALAQREAEKVAKEKARQAAEAVRERERRETLETQRTKEATALTQREIEKAAKEKARHIAEVTREGVRQEAIETKKPQEATAMAQKEAEKAAKEKARMEAELARERARQETIEAKKAQEVAAMAKKEAEAAAKEKARQEALEAKRAKEAVAKAEKSRVTVATMVPLFNRRSIIVIGTGLVVGLVLAFGYWFLSPSFSSPPSVKPSNPAEPAGLSGMIGAPQNVPYKSSVIVQFVNPGSSYTSLDDLRRIAEYYTAKANSLPFSKFLSQELAKQAPQYSHSIDELSQMISIAYYYSSQAQDTGSQSPSIKLTVTGSSDQEASFLAGFVPQTFQNYLITEQKDKQQQEYENTLKAIENGKAELLKAEQEANAFKPPDSYNFNQDPTYIALNAKVNALESEVNRQATQQATMTVNGVVGKDSKIQEQEYQKVLQAVKATSLALSKAEEELKPLEIEKTTSNIQNDPDYIILNAKISALETELNRQMTGYTQVNSIGQQEPVLGLAQMIALGTTTGSEYTTTLKNVESTSLALSEARKQFSILGSQSSNNNSMANSDYLIAQAKVDTLNKELTALSEKLTLLAPVSVIEENQTDTQTVYERTTAALADTRKELSALVESKAGGPSGDPNYDIAQAKVKSLNTLLANLTAKSSSLFMDNIAPAETTGYLVAGNPSIPSPVLPERTRARNALMMGAVVGVGGAWVLLNRRWLVKTLSSSPSPKKEDEEEI